VAATAAATAAAHRPAHGGRPAPPRAHVDLDILKAIAWCRIGGRHFRPSSDAAFGRAKRLGLLAQDNVWRATPQGEGVLIAAGLLKGAAAPERVTIHVLWATSQRYPRPQFVAAWPDGLVECWRESYEEQRAEAERFFTDFGDEEWEFWTTIEHLDAPAEAGA
jgi:hypothetical protein